MSRYTGPSWKVSRRLHYSVLGTGKELQKRDFVPGQHGRTEKKVKISEYGKQMAEKQKLRNTYGVSEKQFRRFFKMAKADKTQVTGLAFMRILESRLDNMVYRLNFATTRRQARQLVNHGHILVNGAKVDVPSYLVKVGDVISVREKSQSLEIVKKALENEFVVKYVELDKNKFSGKMIRLPERDELTKEIDEAQIVEFYNRKM